MESRLQLPGTYAQLQEQEMFLGYILGGPQERLGPRVAGAASHTILYLPLRFTFRSPQQLIPETLACTKWTKDTEDSPNPGGGVLSCWCTKRNNHGSEGLSRPRRDLPTFLQLTGAWIILGRDGHAQCRPQEIAWTG